MLALLLFNDEPLNDEPHNDNSSVIDRAYANLRPY